jgi:hypothetical protein
MNDEKNRCGYAKRNELEREGRMISDWSGSCRHKITRGSDGERYCSLYFNSSERREGIRVPGASADHVVRWGKR